MSERAMDPLLQATQITVLRHINNIINQLPVPHEVINYNEKSRSLAEEQYHDKMEDFFADTHWLKAVFQLTKALYQYLTSLPLLPWKQGIPEESLKDLARFGTLFLEVGCSYIGVFS